MYPGVDSGRLSVCPPTRIWLLNPCNGWDSAASTYTPFGFSVAEPESNSRSSVDTVRTTPRSSRWTLTISPNPACSIALCSVWVSSSSPVPVSAPSAPSAPGAVITGASVVVVTASAEAEPLPAPVSVASVAGLPKSPSPSLNFSNFFKSILAITHNTRNRTISKVSRSA